MFDIGLQEMLVIGVIALLVFGPTKLPELGRMFGRAMREFRRASEEFRSTVETNLQINEHDPFPEPTATPTSIPSESVPALPESPAPEPLHAALDGTPGVDTTSPGDSAEPFWAQRGSRLFHRRDCGWAARIAEMDRVYLKSVTDAREQGFVNCPVCDPWEA